VRALLERGSPKVIDAELTVSPAATGWDGFYAARLK
jgi:hypothetical protein